MKSHRATAFADATPLDGRGHRTPQTMLLLDERDKLLRRAVAQHLSGQSQREAARQLRSALVRYRAGCWRRISSEVNNPHDEGTLNAILCLILRTRDSVPSVETVRRALSA